MHLVGGFLPPTRQADVTALKKLVNVGAQCFLPHHSKMWSANIEAVKRYTTRANDGSITEDERLDFKPAEDSCCFEAH